MSLIYSHVIALQQIQRKRKPHHYSESVHPLTEPRGISLDALQCQTLHLIKRVANISPALFLKYFMSHPIRQWVPFHVVLVF